MTVVDWVIVALAVLMAMQGYARGFLVGVCSLAGFAAGALLGSRIGPAVLSGGSHSPWAPAFALGGALLLGMLLGSLCEGVARRLRRFLFFPPVRMIDGLAGALLTACIGLGIAWIAGATLLQSAGSISLPANLRTDIQQSVILRALNRALPPSGPILNALARVDPLPSVSGRVASVPAPDGRIVSASGPRRALASVVRITGQACGLGVEGSGWVAGPGLVVTNAHVVAGETDTVVQLRGVGATLPASAVVFDPHNDIAILRVPGLRAPALQLASGPAAGTPAAILGFPLDGGLNSQPARLGQTQFTATQDAYGRPTVRQISSLRGLVRPGNSGGPMVGPGGRVVGTVFAEITNAPAGQPGGYAVPDAVVEAELSKARVAHSTVSTQTCAD